MIQNNNNKSQAGSVFTGYKGDTRNAKIFLDDNGSVDIARFDTVKYPIFEKQLERMNSFIWRPTEINLKRDKIDFDSLDRGEQFLFTTNLFRQVVLDSIAGRGLSEALLPIVSDPTVEACIMCIAYFENNIHAKAYQHIIRNIYNNPTEVFDNIKKVDIILKMARTVSKYYDNLVDYTQRYQQGQTKDLKGLKTVLWKFLHGLNAMEALRFYNSFTCSFSFDATGRMVGNGAEIRSIANDESLHVAFSTALIRKLPDDDEAYIDISKENKEECTQIYVEVIEEEDDFVDYGFQYGSTMGLNQDILKGSLRFRAKKIMHAVHLEYPGDAPVVNPTPWMKNYMNEENLQVAPQETEITSYIKGAEVDVDEDTFAGFTL